MILILTCRTESTRGGHRISARGEPDVFGTELVHELGTNLKKKGTNLKKKGAKLKKIKRYKTYKVFSFLPNF